MESVNIKELNDRIQRESSFVDILTMEMNKVIVGQKHLVENLLIGLLANGHILLEGVPGLAKTLAINTLASAVDARFSRIQFTPDLLPADVIGTMIYSQKSEQFQIRKGPVFANFVLADEINRSPAKVQSALLEAILFLTASKLIYLFFPCAFKYASHVEEISVSTSEYLGTQLRVFRAYSEVAYKQAGSPALRSTMSAGISLPVIRLAASNISLTVTPFSLPKLTFKLSFFSEM